jgi:hypothetical protein
MPTQPRAARRRLNDSSQPDSQASQAGTNRPAARSPARNWRTSDLNAPAAAGSGLTGGKSVPSRILRHLRPASPRRGHPDHPGHPGPPGHPGHHRRFLASHFPLTNYCPKNYL